MKAIANWIYRSGSAWLGRYLVQPGLWAACFILIPLSAAAEPARETFTWSDLHEAFIKTAFGVEIQDKDSRPGLYIRKFAEPVRYDVRSADPQRSADVEKRMSQIALISGLDIAPVNGNAKANFFIYVYPVSQKTAINRKVMREQNYTVSKERLAIYDRVNCRFSIFPSPQGTQKSIVFLPMVDEPDWSYCLSEELIQALGLLNDADSITHTVFNDSRDSKSFAPFDLHLLRMLADPRIRPGMSVREVEQVLDDDFPVETAELPFSQLRLDRCRQKGGKLKCRQP